MKKVLILFGKKNKNLLFSGEKAKKNAEEMFEIGKKVGIKYYRASILRYNKNKNVFDEVWMYTNRKWIKEKNVKPDLIFDKSPWNFEEEKIKKDIVLNFNFANDFTFEQIGNNKFLAYSFFKEWMPFTKIVYSACQLNNIIKNFKSSRVVIKPNYGSGGKNVQIVKKKNLKNITIKKYPVIAQEFIDSSFGIKGLIDGVHDLRIIFFNQNYFLSYVTQPQEGIITDNSEKNIKTLISRKDLPKNLKKELKKITSKLKCFDNIFYSIDFFFNKKQKFYIIEINPSPNIRIDDLNIKKRYHNRLSEHFANIKL